MRPHHILFIIFSFFLAPSLFAAEVCLKVELMDTAHPKHPNKAREVADMNKSFDIRPDQKNCFDLSKSYYMQYFMSENEKVIIYGTKCRYNPQVSHEGLVLIYKGLSGGSICPVISELSEDSKIAAIHPAQAAVTAKRQALRHSVSSFGFPRNFRSVKK